ncbi:MAG: stage V sporulation protein AA, partial [Paenibacillus sp. RIFOXYA1_FULL_44_5]
IDMMMVVQKVNALFPTMKIEHFGDPSTLLEIASAPRRIPFLLLGFVWFILFIGSGLAIMNFHADVSMLEVHQRFYELLTGKHNEHPYLLQIPYSIGLGLGMLLFFNHIFRKKFNEEPSPLEVEMFMYQQNMNQYMVMNEYAKKSSRKGQQKEEQE